jgi:hypothetical protein
MKGIVYIVHCVDAEGPLYDPELQTYGDWDTIESMLERATKGDFRCQVKDSSGSGWIYNWFCLDHVGYEENIRRRDLGHHKVFGHYEGYRDMGDGVYFHYHPLPHNRAAHSCATRYFNQNHLYEILARKVIDRLWFPAVFRPGFHTLRPDSNWFLEQWIPFDFSNQACDAELPADHANGRWGDWRRATKKWKPYHPSYDDYQIPGEMRRWIFRCLNMQARLRRLEWRDVLYAFHQAWGKTGRAILSFTDHDFRDIGADVERVSKMIACASELFPEVEFKYCNAVDGARQYLGFEPSHEIGLKLNIDSSLLHVTSETDLFGPQPFLAIKTKEGKYFYDNFDFDVVPRSWFYTLDWQTFPPESIEKVGIASANADGLVEVLVYDFVENKLKKALHNL